MALHQRYARDRWISRAVSHFCASVVIVVVVVVSVIVFVNVSTIVALASDDVFVAVITRPLRLVDDFCCCS